MSQVSAPDDSTAARRAPATPVQRVETVEELEAQLGRHLVRSRRQGDLVALLWVELELLTHADLAPAGPSRGDVADALGARLQHRVRRTDHVIQVGAAGFAVLLDADKAGARIVKQRLIKELRGPYGIEGRLAHVSLGIGLAASLEAYRQGISLLRCALDDLADQHAPSVALPALAAETPA